ncbi:subtype B tannase [Paenibacillus bovis]|uniref:Alpha/beta hydrolase n=1 Tax=Paenibacillus bovis TaxID=1616788 RepID=A0A172ZHG9_9BACL|nr:subtype B tannase [Paenibacillus bovis]ANF97085.1 alpha/beta hydrolase [Paenibacillus bovis]
MKAQKWFASLLVSSMLIMPLNSISAASDTTSGQYSLDFSTASYTQKTMTVNGQSITFRAYENVVYVSNPVDTKYEIMNIYVPEQYYEGGTIGSYSADTAPIFFPNSIGGYMPAEPGSPGQGMGGGNNAALLALSKGYVVASPGARGRTTQDESGTYTGKAPAAIVDLKAAVRYLRHNDKIMPGDAEKIISNGTSAGGALSALLGASGNNPDYEPYLQAIGAADERDDIFAVSAYTPITNLDNANAAYEWEFSGINDYSKLEISTDTDYHIQRKTVKGTLTADQIQVSNELSAMFPAYVNSLNLKNANGNALTLDENGEGTFRDYLKSLVISSAQKALDSGTDLSDKSWITISNGKVTDINYDQYVQYLGRMKTPGAFDALDLSAGENQLFGTATTDTQHFTEYAQAHSTVADSTMADATTIKLMNPMNYIGTESTDTSKNWRIRFGTKDSDTANAISAILATTLKNKGYAVDFALPWDVPHSGDYDLQELFTWMADLTGGNAVNSGAASDTSTTSTGGTNAGMPGTPPDENAGSGTDSAVPTISTTATSVTARVTTAVVMVADQKATTNGYNIKGSNYFPLENMAAVLSSTLKRFDVTTGQQSSKIQLTSGQSYTDSYNISTLADSQKAAPIQTAVYLDGKPISISGYTVNGNSYFKMRDIAKALNFNVTWDSASSTLQLDTSSAYQEEVNG